MRVLHSLRSLVVVIAVLLITALFSLSVLPDAEAMVGGKDIPRSQDPAVLFITARTNQCTGSLIFSDRVLTAAHCVEFINQHPSFVRLIRVHLDEKEGRDVDLVTLHPTEDLAILRLSKPVTTIRPLDFTHLTPSKATDCKGVGFGDRYNRLGRYQSRDAFDTIKRKGKIELLDGLSEGKYAVTKKIRFWLRRLMPLASDENSPVAMTEGDSGSPLICEGKLAGVLEKGLVSGAGARIFWSQEFFLSMANPSLLEFALGFGSSTR